jgi:hypothetical protein
MGTTNRARARHQASDDERHRPSAAADAELPLILELVPIATLRPHPRNYQMHPDDELDHLKQSLTTHGVYRNVVVARDGTILAGHGVVVAAAQLGWTQMPVRRLDLAPDDPRALKVLIGDNEMARLSLRDDRALTEMLKEITEAVAPDLDALLGTGFDATMLAALTYTTRPASEIADKDTAAQWVGMPEYDESTEPPKLVLAFRTAEDRERCGALLGLTLADPEKKTLSAWWPPKERDDPASLKFEG